MSNIISKYEISVWNDILVNGEFIEEKVCVIGADDMSYQGKAIQPQLTRKANGEKKFTFKMYKQFVDVISGEKINNPFCDFLANERKVKLYYEDKWYDFVIKNIVENSSTHLNTYQLEDALVQELAKNGFEVALDAELMNNLGSVEELATEVLKDTDWDVESDLFTEKIEEALVYINLTQDITAYRIMETGGDMDGDPVLTTLKKSSTILGFYSSCKNKPHRFQFIYLDKKSYGDYQKDLIPVNENRVIQVQDCQYYIDIPLQAAYQASGDYFLPSGMQVIIRNISGLQDIADTTVSNWFRGARFGFSQKTMYVPLLETYCQLYTRPGELVDGKPAEYFGYLSTEYNSPVFMENVITNSEFKGSTGWMGTYKGFTPNAKNDYGAKIRSTYGHFINPGSGTTFETAEDALKNGRFEDSEFKSYLSVEFPEKSFANQQDQCFVINSGFYDNRHKIKNILPGEEWVFDITVRGPSGVAWTVFNYQDYLDIGLYEIGYKTSSGGHSIGACWGKVNFTSGKHNILTITRPSGLESDLTQKQFEAKEIKLVIKPTNKFTSSVKQFYIEDIKLYKKVTKEIKGVETILTPGDYDIEGVVTNIYSFVKKKAVEQATEKEELKVENIKFEEIDYSTNVPVYNDKAQKTRTVSIKESNYFNILQSISETFEAWLEIIAYREDDDNPGRITSKKIRFNKYLGSDNHAAFRYGVNLKDIQRTFESKKIVTKLIVKQNSNELGKSGFCTIARAGSNPTGENNIYDFRYFHNTGMLNSSDYVAQLYYSKNPYTQETESGKDIDPSHNNTNAQNFFNRLKKINSQLEDNGNRIIGLTKELVQLEADKKVQEGLKSTAEQGLEETREGFYALTGLYPNELDTNPFTSIDLTNPDKNPWGNLETLNPTWNATEHTTIKATQNGGKNSTEWTFDVAVQNNYSDDNCTIPTQKGSETDSPREKFVPYGTVTIEEISGGVRLICGSDTYCGVKFAPVDGYSINFGYQLSYTLKVTSGMLVSIGSHGMSFKDERISLDGGKTYTSATAASIQKQVGQSIDVIVEGTYFINSKDDEPYLFIQPNRGSTTAVTCEITNIVLKQKTYATTDKTRTFYFQAHFTKSRGTGATTEPETVKLACSIAGKTLNGSVNHSFALVNTSGSTLSKLLSEYVEYQKQLSSATKALGTEKTAGLISSVNNKQDQVNTLETERKNLLEQKAALNKAFYSIYSRFIQEGTWISEEYVDDDKYYNDALSVLYNSCFPQVAYSINVISVSSLPGYEHFKFHLGDKTYVEDPEFFGTEDKFEVVITEQNDYLDEPSKSTVKVQNFKNQFQDLFQKITATVQQTQYSTGSYEKAVALAEADVKIRGKFVTDALEGMAGKLAVAGQTTVVMDSSGITLTDASTKDEMRLIGGAILMSIADPETGERKWKTGLTPQGISASLVTTGTLNAGNISIMNVAEPVFRWDAFGLTAYDIDWNNGYISGQTNPYKFVRFDKHGIYGIDQEGASEAVDGCNWKPSSLDEIQDLATFALTWSGLKVTSPEGSIATIGRSDNRMISIFSSKKEETFYIDDKGNASFKGHIEATSGTIGPLDIQAIIDSANQPNPNLLKKTKEKKTNNSYAIASYSLARTPKAGEKYTISFIATPGPQVKSIGIYNSDGNTWLASISASSGEGGYYKGTFTWNDKKDGTASTSVVIFMMRQSDINQTSDSTARDQSSIELVKLEEGSTATGWIAATEDEMESLNGLIDEELKKKLDADAPLGNYKWQFSPSSGIVMKSGNEEVFKVGNIDGVSGLKIKGIIYATAGSFGGWTIGENMIYYRPEPSEGKDYMVTDFIRPIGNTTEKYFVSGTYNSSGSKTDWRIFIGGKKTEYKESRSVQGGFGVDSTGQLHSTNAVFYDSITINQQWATCTLDGMGIKGGVLDSSYELGSDLVIDGGGAGKVKLNPGSLKFSSSEDKHLGQIISGNSRSGMSITPGGGDNVGTLSGTWKTYSGNVVDSDQRLKHDIEILEEKYSDFFDLLSPCRYKYNNGTSNRYHIGYIAQEIQNSLQKAGITEQEFAGIATCYNEEIGEDTMGLRYIEFISLNTWQIQKLKLRVSELEKKIEDLTSS